MDGAVFSAHALLLHLVLPGSTYLAIIFCIVSSIPPDFVTEHMYFATAVAVPIFFNAKFGAKVPNLKPANIFLRSVWGRNAKFKDHQYF